jgi:hypothetical protein
MNKTYLRSINRPDISAQWHVEAATGKLLTRVFVVTVLQPYRKGAVPAGKVEARRQGDRLEILAGGKTVTLRDGKDFFKVR